MSDTKISSSWTCPSNPHALDGHDVRHADDILTLAHQRAGGSDKRLRLTNGTFDEHRAHERPGGGPRDDARHIVFGSIHVGGELAEIAFHANHMMTAARHAARVGATGTALVIFETMATLPHAWGAGDVGKGHIERDLRFTALLVAVRDVLPHAYVYEQTMGKRRETAGFQSQASTIAAKLHETPGAITELLLHVDAGMHLAKRCLDAKVDAKALLASQPELAERYEKDAAFKIGFDAVLSAAAESPASLENVLSRLRARDARCEAPVQIGG